MNPNDGFVRQLKLFAIDVELKRKDKNSRCNSARKEVDSRVTTPQKEKRNQFTTISPSKRKTTSFSLKTPNTYE